MQQCPACGKVDYDGLGFCTACGKILPKEERVRTSGVTKDYSGIVDERPMTYEELLINTVSGIMFTVFMAVFIFFYLFINNADPLLIIMIESFPILWFVLIIIQWRENKGRIKNAK